MSKKFIENIEIAKPGYANGISLQLYKKQQEEGPEASLTETEKNVIIEEAAVHYGKFLTALGCDWENDPNSDRTPFRVAKSFVHHLWEGRFNPAPLITAFPNEHYDGMVFEGGIPLQSMCAHHSQPITGKVYVAYIPSKGGKVVGLSKLNRLVELFGRRSQIQENLTIDIHNAIDKICEGHLGAAVFIEATHMCVSARGIKHHGASMKTSKLSGCFLTEDAARAEFYEFIKGYTK